MFWLSSLPQFHQFRDVSVSTSNFALDPDDDASDIDDGVYEERLRTRPVRYLPSYVSNYGMWYKGRYIAISRTKDNGRWMPNKSTLVITLVSSVHINCTIPLIYFP